MLVSEFHELQSKTKEFILIDIRELYEYEHLNIGAMHIPMGEFLDRLDEIPSNKLVILHCQSGNRAQKLTEVLHSLGYNHVQNLEGGIDAYLNFKSHIVHE